MSHPSESKTDTGPSKEPQKPSLSSNEPKQADSTREEEKYPEDGAAARIAKVMDALPEGLSNQARLLYYLIERAREAYRQRDHAACEEQCLALLNQAFLPNYARIETLLLLSGVVKISESFVRLDEALGICDEIEGRRGAVLIVQKLRELAAELRKEFTEAWNLEKGKKGPAEEVGEATGSVE